MKTRLTLLLLLSFSVVAFGQKMPSDYFQEANDYFEEGEWNKALAGFLYIVENHPRNELYPRALNNAGDIYLLQKKYKKAIEVFTLILNGNQDEREPSGGDIMASPYANYCHWAARQISNCYYELRRYDSALCYWALADTAYPFLSGCGNAYAENDINTALRYADIYQKLGQPDSAIEKLLPEVFNTGLADNSKIIAELEKLLKGKPKLLKKLDKAIDGVYLKIFTSDYGDYDRYCIQWLGVEIVYPYKPWENDTKESVKKKMRESEFYKMVANMKR
jgi:tetratricopeptide (TPR) repeat protein